MIFFIDCTVTRITKHIANKVVAFKPPFPANLLAPPTTTAKPPTNINKLVNILNLLLTSSSVPNFKSKTFFKAVIVINTANDKANTATITLEADVIPSLTI